MIRPYRMRAWDQPNLTVDWGVVLVEHGLPDLATSIDVAEVSVMPDVVDGLAVLLGPLTAGAKTTVRVGGLQPGDYWVAYRITASDGQRFETLRLVILQGPPAEEEA